MPRRVLKALRLVLVDHVDDVLREALVLPDAERDLRASRRTSLEYRGGELFTSAAVEPAAASAAVPSLPGEQPGA